MTARSKKNLIKLGSETIAVYATPKLSSALDTVTADMTLVQGVRFIQILEAVYSQGKKDGARKAFEAVSTKVLEAERAVPHKNPGKPRKRR